MSAKVGSVKEVLYQLVTAGPPEQTVGLVEGLFHK
jgi:hypothetical protein